jgi:hypothetical protein
MALPECDPAKPENRRLSSPRQGVFVSNGEPSLRMALISRQMSVKKRKRRKGKRVWYSLINTL